MISPQCYVYLYIDEEVNDLTVNFYKTSKWKAKRLKVLRRDEYRCRDCIRYGKTTEATTAHHVNPLESRPELALASWNLISLCTKCHDKMHDRVTGQLTTAGLYWKEKIIPPS
ncbi:HNH endonuclease [Paenibacillus sp. LMG 31461]|uniref:Putative HNH nuclease YajD n=1 Tax=Paenibacillus plantarum TaxID=2654975 RepID=A0ABX1X433_9BACL|nr:HNH endonuclease [Paenibacillus plantarum]NOU63168.1 HNH endonuclease [Paenibacillus plantarum]